MLKLSRLLTALACLTSLVALPVMPAAAQQLPAGIADSVTYYIYDTDSVEFTLEKEQAVLTLQPGSGSRGKSCRDSNLLTMLKHVKSEFGSAPPLGNFHALVKELKAADSQGYLWFQDCNPDDAEAEGLVCVDPYVSPSAGVNFVACAYAEGSIEHNTGDGGDDSENDN